MVEGARLESVYTATYRGFESLSLRHQSFPGCPEKSLIPIKYVSIQHPFLKRMQLVDLSGFCNRDVAAELTGTTSRVLIN